MLSRGTRVHMLAKLGNPGDGTGPLARVKQELPLQQRLEMKALQVVMAITNGARLSCNHMVQQFTLVLHLLHVNPG